MYNYNNNNNPIHYNLEEENLEIMTDNITNNSNIIEEDDNSVGATLLTTPNEEDDHSLLLKSHHSINNPSSTTFTPYLTEDKIHDLTKNPYRPLFGKDEDQQDNDSTEENKKKGFKDIFKKKNWKKAILYFFTDFYYLFIQYIRFTWKEITKRKVGYIIGTLSCFVVVWMIILSLSALSQVPLVFVRLAELQVGEFDIKISADPYVPGVSLNYTLMEEQIQNITKFGDKYSYHSPRVIFENSKIYHKCHVNDLYSVDWMYNVTDTCGNREKIDRIDTSDYNDGKFCVPNYCEKQFDKVTLFLMDTLKEKRMGFGRNYPFDPLKKGECIITGALANALQIKIGDSIILDVETMDELIGVYREANILSQESNDLNSLRTRRVTFNAGKFYVPIKVVQIIDDYYGKFANNMRDAILMEYEPFVEHFSHYLPPQLFTEEEMNLVSKVNLYHYAENIYINHPPNRLDAYNENDYKKVQERITGFAAEFLYLTGYNQVSSDFPILETMKTTEFFALFVGLIISIIVIVLSSLSIVLIYSLLMINVENRRFEMGVFRMIGMKRIHVVQLILVQAICFYGIPSWIIGLIIGQLSFSGVSIILSKTLQAPVTYVITFEAFALGTLIGILVPVIASILPIIAALGQNLHDSLDTQRSKSQAVKYSVERAEGEGIAITPIAIGIISAVFGFAIYYVFPLSLITLNVTIMLYIFMAVILCMLLGAILLSLNLENSIEFIVVLFTIQLFESSAVVDLVEKNLVSHRERNRKTTLMFALSLGFIIFSSVLFNTQITAFRYNILRSSGTTFVVGTSRSLAFVQNPKLIEDIDNFCTNHPEWVEGCTYWTFGLQHNINSPISGSNIKTTGGLKKAGIKVRGIAPNFFKVTNSKFLNIVERNRPQSSSPFTEYAYGLDEYLYTIDGGSKLILGSYFKKLLNADINEPVALEVLEATQRLPIVTNKLFEVMAYIDSCPVALYSAFPNFGTQDTLVSIPTYLRLLNGTKYSATRLPIDTFFFKLTDTLENDSNQRQVMKSKLKAILNQYNGPFIRDVKDEIQPIEIAVSVMNFFFLFTTLVAMTICFFSLVSSMYTNVNEQSKEIGILRSIGVRKWTIIRIYIYEAFVLICAASISGVVIGFIISYTMASQNTLITQLPIDFLFPWQITLMIFGSAILFSFVASFFPVYQLLKLPIVDILKKMLV
ncbi:hypothetical protein ABK040_003498 [Willaertia magna]